MATAEFHSERPPAPFPLARAQAFINSTVLDEDIDAFASTETLQGWIANRYPGVALDISEADRQRAIAVREALRDLLDALTAGEPATPAWQTLQDLTGDLVFRMAFDPHEGLTLAPRGVGVDAVLGDVIAAIHHATIDGTISRLKTCRNDACRWAFYDASKNRSGVWCSMASCGNQAKARSYRRRTRAQEDRS